MKLTLYLFKPHVQRFSECLKPKSEARSYRDITSSTQKEEDPDIRIYALEKDAKPPEWANFVARFADSSAIDQMKTQTAAALLLIRIETGDGPRMFAATYGSSFTLLETALTEQDFGLKTTLNSISPSRIKSINYKKVSGRSVGKTESASQAASIAAYTFDREGEALKSITGASLDYDLGLSISGGGSLKISIKDLHPEQLKTTAQKAYDTYVKKDYRKHFDFIDNFEEEKDPAAKAALDQQLIEQLLKPAPPAELHAVYPEQIPARLCSYFRLGVGNTRETFDDIKIQDITKFLQGNASQLDIETVKLEASLTGLDDNEEASTPKKSIFTSLATEAKIDSTRYTLSGGTWFKIDNSFFDETKEWLRETAQHTSLAHKTWFASQGEWEYSQQYENESDTILISGKTFKPKHHGDILMADLFHAPTNTLIFVKQLSSGTPLAALCEQATQTANLLREESDEAWSFLENFLKEKSLPFSKSGISKSLNIAFFINSEEALPDSFAFFDALAYKRMQKNLQKLQIPVAIKAIATGL